MILNRGERSFPLRADTTLPDTMLPMELHRLAEERSIAIHRLIAARLPAQPEILAAARNRVGEWSVRESVPVYYRDRWAELLDGPVEDLQELLVSDDEEAREMRQVSPFAGAIPPRERWQIWREVRERLGA